MARTAFLFFFLFASFYLNSQKVTYSKSYPTVPKNIPLAIINRHPDYFFLLRSNRLAHDLTIERRAKPNGEMLSFTPLKLDSVNASWFDYERLDYLFFEQQGKVYFVFERAFNNKKTIFLKVIEITGHSSGFIELAELEKDKNVSDIAFEWKRTQDRLLIIADRQYSNGTIKKVATLYDPAWRKVNWVKTLPMENSSTGYSTAFACNAGLDLYYAIVRWHVAGFERRYINHAQKQIPVIDYDNISLLCLKNDGSGLIRQEVETGEFLKINSLLVKPGSNSVKLLLHYTQAGSTGRSEKMCFFNITYNNALDSIRSQSGYPLSASLDGQLKFYDGSDYDEAADKDYSLWKEVEMRGGGYQISGRREQNFYKELLVWKDVADTVSGQFIVPRKLYYLMGDTRYRNIGLSAHAICGGNFFSMLLEARSNFQKPVTPFKYHKFRKQNSLGGANAVCYVIRQNGRQEKTLLHRNAEYVYVPLEYDSDRCDFVFYLARRKIERFAILDLGQL